MLAFLYFLSTIQGHLNELKRNDMSNVCQITGKGPSSGHNVSHSNRKTKRRFLPNIFKKKVLNPATGKWETMKVSAHGLRILKKRMK